MYMFIRMHICICLYIDNIHVYIYIDTWVSIYTYIYGWNGVRDTSDGGCDVGVCAYVDLCI